MRYRYGQPASSDESASKNANCPPPRYNLEEYGSISGGRCQGGCEKGRGTQLSPALYEPWSYFFLGCALAASLGQQGLLLLMLNPGDPQGAAEEGGGVEAGEDAEHHGDGEADDGVHAGGQGHNRHDGDSREGAQAGVERAEQGLVDAGIDQLIRWGFCCPSAGGFPGYGQR